MIISTHVQCFANLCHSTMTFHVSGLQWPHFCVFTIIYSDWCSGVHMFRAKASLDPWQTIQNQTFKISGLPLLGIRIHISHCNFLLLDHSIRLIFWLLHCRVQSSYEVHTTCQTWATCSASTKTSARQPWASTAAKPSGQPQAEKSARSEPRLWPLMICLLKIGGRFRKRILVQRLDRSLVQDRKKKKRRVTLWMPIEIKESLFCHCCCYLFQ